MSENLKCNVCGGEISEDDLALLKIQKKIECRYCKNLIVLDEKTATIKEDLCCVICGGALAVEDLSEKALACKYCQNDLEEISYSEANYPEIFNRLKAIPEEKIIEAYKILMREENFTQLNEDDQIKLKTFGESFIPKMKEIYKANKWDMAAKAIGWLGHSLGTLLGLTLLGGTIGGAVGVLLSVLGVAFIRGKAK